MLLELKLVRVSWVHCRDSRILVNGRLREKTSDWLNCRSNLLAHCFCLNTLRHIDDVVNVHLLPVSWLTVVLLVLLVLVEWTLRSVCLSAPACESSFNSICCPAEPFLAFVISRQVTTSLVLAIVGNVFLAVGVLVALTLVEQGTLFLPLLLHLSFQQLCKG